MPSLFPTSNDSFSEPSSPSTTALASAGDATRNHWQHHRDLGDAIEAIENNVPLTTHDHSGTGARATPKLKQVNTHEDADTNVGNTSIHHTLGAGDFQALSLPVAKTELDKRYMRLDGTINQTITGIKTLDRPAVSNFLNAQHNHSSASQGGFSVNAVLREEINLTNYPGTPLQTIDSAFFRSFNVPAGLRVGGTIFVDLLFQANALQQTELKIYMGPTGLTAVNTGTFATNYYTPAVVRWPGSAAAVGGASSGFWFFDGENVRITVPVAFQFIQTGAARNNQSIYLRTQIGSGAGITRLASMKSEISLETDLGN